MHRILPVALVLMAGLAPGPVPIAVAQDQNQDQAEETGDDERRVRRLRDSLAIDPETEWQPNLDTSNLDAEIQRKLGAAERAFQAGDLTSPPQANALYYFRQVLDVDPQNRDAQQGVGRVADQLVAQARSAQEAGDRAAAVAYIEAVKAFRPNYPGLQTLEDEITRRGEIVALLATAEEQIANSRLTSPEGDNALESLRAVLAIDSGNADAQDGLQRVESALLARAQSAIGSDDFVEAGSLIESAESVRGGSPAVDEARTALDEARQAAWEQRLQQAQASIREGDLDSAEASLQGLAEAGYPDVDELDALRAEIDRIRRLRAFPPGSTLTDELASGGTAPTITVVPAGSFTMGSPSGERDRSENEGPTREITFTIPFGLGETEVTVADFRRFVEATGYVTSAEETGESTIYNVLGGGLKTEAGITWRQDFQGQEAKDEEPVVHVSWNDAKAYAEWLASETGQPYRLPSEAEFEYALRGGTDSPYWWGSGTPREEVENLTGERDRMAGRWEWPDPFDRYGDDHWGPAPVKSFQPNPFGLYDIGGNVLEWVADCYSAGHANAPADGSAVTTGNCGVHVLKGGGWALPPAMSRSASRSSAQSDRSTCLVGFRVARDL